MKPRPRRLRDVVAPAPGVPDRGLPQADSHRRSKVRRVAGMIYLGATCVVALLSLVIPGLILPAWKPLVALLCLLAAACTALLRRNRFSDRFTLPLIAYADVSIAAYALVHADPQVARTALALLVLPTLYVALFHDTRTLVVQSTVITVFTAFVLERSGLPAAVVGLQTVQLLLAAASPAASVLMLRGQLERSVRRSHRMAVTDPLTGLANRRGMDESFPALIDRSRLLGLPLGVLVADVDHFKRVNDELGHAAGDQVLQMVAATTQACVRRDDLVVRLGGEEIAVVTVLEVAQLYRLAERVRERVEAEGADRGVTVSLGVAWELPPDELPPGGPDFMLQSLVGRADALMYEAKRAGRNRVRIPA